MSLCHYAVSRPGAPRCWQVLGVNALLLRGVWLTPPVPYIAATLAAAAAAAAARGSASLPAAARWSVFADPCPLVSSAAAAALAAVCRYNRYSDLSQLVSVNADYVV